MSLLNASSNTTQIGVVSTTSWTARAGPYFYEASGDSYLYAILLNATLGRLQVVRSLDLGASWSLTADTTTVTANGPYSTCVSGTLIWVIYFSGTTLFARSFNMATNTWGTATTLSTSATAANCRVVARPNGQLVALWIKSLSVYVSRYSAGAWTTEALLAGSYNGGVKLIDLYADSNNHVHIFYQAYVLSTYNQVIHRAYNSSNALQASDVLDATPAAINNTQAGTILPATTSSTALDYIFRDSSGKLSSYPVTLSTTSWTITLGTQSDLTATTTPSNVGALSFTQGGVRYAYWTTTSGIYTKSYSAGWNAVDTQYRGGYAASPVITGAFIGSIGVILLFSATNLTQVQAQWHAFGAYSSIGLYKDTFSDGVLDTGYRRTALGFTVTESNKKQAWSLASGTGAFFDSRQDYWVSGSDGFLFQLVTCTLQANDSFEVQLVSSTTSGKIGFALLITPGTSGLNATVYTGGTPASINVTYQPSVHRWFRFNSSGLTYTIDYSFEGANWTNLVSGTLAATPVLVSPPTLFFHGNASATTGYLVEVANFNIVPVTAVGTVTTGAATATADPVVVRVSPIGFVATGDASAQGLAATGLGRVGYATVTLGQATAAGLPVTAVGILGPVPVGLGEAVASGGAVGGSVVTRTFVTTGGAAAEGNAVAIFIPVTVAVAPGEVRPRSAILRAYGWQQKWLNLFADGALRDAWLVTLDQQIGSDPVTLAVDGLANAVVKATQSVSTGVVWSILLDQFVTQHVDVWASVVPSQEQEFKCKIDHFDLLDATLQTISHDVQCRLLVEQQVAISVVGFIPVDVDVDAVVLGEVFVRVNAVIQQQRFITGKANALVVEPLPITASVWAIVSYLPRNTLYAWADAFVVALPWLELQVNAVTVYDREWYDLGAPNRVKVDVNAQVVDLVPEFAFAATAGATMHTHAPDPTIQLFPNQLKATALHPWVNIDGKNLEPAGLPVSISKTVEGTIFPEDTTTRNILTGLLNRYGLVGIASTPTVVPTGGYGTAQPRQVSFVNDRVKIEFVADVGASAFVVDRLVSLALNYQRGLFTVLTPLVSGYWTSTIGVPLVVPLEGRFVDVLVFCSVRNSTPFLQTIVLAAVQAERTIDQILEPSYVVEVNPTPEAGVAERRYPIVPAGRNQQYPLVREAKVEVDGWVARAIPHFMEKPFIADVV